MGLGTVVGVALLGTSPSGPVAAPMAAAPAVTPSPVTPSVTPSSSRSLRIDQPARRDEVVTTRELVVRGRVSTRVGEVRIMLESRGGKPIGTRAIDPTGMPRGDLIPFEARFQINHPRPSTSMVLFVIALDRDGVPLDAVRRRFALGTILEIK